MSTRRMHSKFYVSELQSYVRYSICVRKFWSVGDFSSSTFVSNIYAKETLESGRHLYDAAMTDIVNSFDKNSVLLPIKKQKVEPIKEEPPKLQAIVQKLRSILQRAGQGYFFFLLWTFLDLRL